MKTVCRLFLIFLVLSTNLWANTMSFPWYTRGDNHKVTINVALFLSSTCPHCHKADAFFRDIELNSPQMHIQRYIINEDKNALILFNQLLTEQQMDDFAVPSIFFCNSRWVGFTAADTTGKDLLHAINYCKQQIEKKGELAPSTINVLQHWANANRFDSGMVEHPSALRYITTIALTDAFNPCAFFCFTGFIAFLLIEGQRKKQIGAAFLFILSVGLVHYFQQAYTNNFFELLTWLRIPVAIVGLTTLYFVIQRFRKRSMCALYFLLAFLSGLSISIYQQTCVMNWSYIFEQWLFNQHVSNNQAALYQLLYQLVYLVPLILTLIVSLFLFRVKRIAAYKSRLVFTGLLLMMAIAFCLIIDPFILSNLALSALMVFIIIISAYFLDKFIMKRASPQEE